MHRFPGLRFFVARQLVRCRRACRRAVGGTTACAATAAWCAYGLTYTAFGVVFAGAALVVTTTVAAACWLISGE